MSFYNSNFRGQAVKFSWLACPFTLIVIFFIQAKQFFNMILKIIKKKKWVLFSSILLLFIIYIRTFIGQPAFIPSGSMENTLLRGDYIWIDKRTYGANLPRRFADIPIINAFTWINYLRKIDEKIDWGYGRVKTDKSPSRGDITVYTSENNLNMLMVKRLVGISGDTVIIKDGELIINGRFFNEQPTIIYTDMDILAEFPENTLWTIHNYGPLIVPKKGMTIEINKDNISWIKKVALKEGIVLTNKDDSLISCDEYSTNSYTFRDNYYFMLGDNRKNSHDSRFTGFISEQDIEGRIEFILFSVDNTFRLSFRKNRFFMKVN